MVEDKVGLLGAGGHLRTRRGDIDFSTPTADTLITGPNEEFLHAIHKAFIEPGQACYIRYGANVGGRTFKKIIVFAVRTPGMDTELRNFIYYLKSRQDPQDESQFHVI